MNDRLQKNLGKLSVLFGGAGCLIMVLVFFIVQDTRTQWAQIESAQGETAGWMRTVFPFIGTTLAINLCLAGTAFGVFGFFQKESNRFMNVLGLVLVAITVVIAGSFIFGMGQFRQG